MSWGGIALRAAFGLLLAQSILVYGCRRSPAETQARYLARGKARLAAKEYSRAILEFRNGVAALPNGAEGHYQLGLAYLGAGDTSEAAAEFRRTVQLEPTHANAQVRLAELMLRGGDPVSLTDAAGYARDALRAAPDNVDAMNALTLAEMKLGNPDDAEEQLRLALEQFPQNVNASVVLAVAKWQKRDLAGAEQALRAAARNAPQSANAVIALGQLYTLMGRWPDAETQFHSAIQLDSKNGAALSALANIQMRQGRNEDAEQTWRVLSQLPDKQYRHLHAAFLMQQRNYEAGLKEFETLAAEDPKDKVPRIRLVEAYLLANRAADAQRVITGALKADPKDVDALFRQTLLYLDAGRQQEAQASLNRLVQLQPRSAAVHYLAAREARIRGDALRRRSELRDAVAMDPRFLPARVELARVLVESNSASAALELINQTPDAQKASLPVVTMRGLILLALDDLLGAAKVIQDGLGIARTPDLLEEEAVLKLRQRDYTGARASANEALARSPENMKALRIVAVTYLAQKRPDEVLKVLQHYAAQHPKSPVAQQFVGEWLVEIGKRDEARAAFTAAKAADPKFYAASLALVRLESSAGNLAGARQEIARVLEADPGNFGAHALAGSLETNAGNFDIAVAHYQRALDARPNSAEVMNNLAYLFGRTGKLDESLRLAQKAHELAPKNPDTTDTVGWALYRKGLYDAAVNMLQAAVAQDGPARDPGAAIRKYHLAMAYAKSGDLNRADDTIAQALKLNTQVAEASEARKVIEEVGSPAGTGGARK